MPEYVYALHDFLPNYEDEVSFHAGELIEVIEKDGMYGDGWWHGRNLAGGVGLFPVSYTATAPPATGASHALLSPEPVPESHGISTSNSKSVLQPLTEESEASGINILSPLPKRTTIPLLNSDYDIELPHEGEASHNLASGDNEMMKTTMTDVQKAIEQLGRKDVGDDGDGDRSFSFASTRDGANTENSDTDFDLSDFDGSGINGNDGEDWHKGARRKLAAKAKRAVEEAENLEAMMGNNENRRRAIVPPIEIDFSDESEVEDDADLTRSSNFRRNHRHIPEEDDNVGTDGEATAATEDTRYSTIDTLSTADVFVPPNDETDIPTATKPTFSASQFPVPTEPLPEEPEEKPPVEKDIYSSPISPPTTTLPNIQQVLRSSTPVREISNGLPSPASIGYINSKQNSMTPSSSAPGMLVSAPQVQQQQPNSTSVVTGPASIPVSTTVQGRNETHPMEWSVKEVVDWLKSKEFDQDVCDKFAEQEITGDVLLELGVKLLKSEIGIMAFGKRMRIANAITDLRRPPSIEYSDHQLSPTQLYHSNSLTHSLPRTHWQIQSQSLPGTTPATTVGHVHSMQSSFGSPGVGYGSQQSGHLRDSPVDINDDMKAAGPMGSGTTAGVPVGMSTAAGVGLGIALSPMNGPSGKGPPSRLLLSSSNAAKKVSTIAVNGEYEECGHSDGEITLNSTSMFRRTFGLSHKSTISTMNASSRSNDFSLSSPIVLDKEKGTSDKATPIVGIRRAWLKRGVNAKPADWLNIFGATIGDTLGKSRKPPPSEDSLTLKASKFSLLRLHSFSIHKSSSLSSHRPSTSDASPQKSSDDFTGMYDEKEKSFNALRKRSSSNSIPNVPIDINANVPEAVNGVSGFITDSQGVDIVDRIGEPDHNGWMRTRGNRFSSWKSRYFILKGPHLYFLRSNNKSETRIKGYIHIAGYKVTVDENDNPGCYGFRIDHDHYQTHYFSSEEKSAIRDWMKAIMKATILRDYAKSVVSSCNISTIPLVVAQAMDPAPRPPSPSARAATQRALRRENTEQLSTRDTRILGLNVTDVKDERARLDSFFSNAAIPEGESNPSSPKVSAPPRPSRQLGRISLGRTAMSQLSQADDSLIKWANTHLPESLQITDSTDFLCTGLGLGLLRLAESINGQPSSPPVLDSAFPVDIHDDKLDGLFRLFNFLLDGDVRIGSVSINDVRLGKRDKIIQLLKALKAWEDKKKAHALSIILKATSPAAFMLV